MDFPKNKIEFQSAWSSCAGELAGLKSAMAIIETSSVQAFLSKDDKLANTLRGIHSDIDEIAKRKSSELDFYIKESARRKI